MKNIKYQEANRGSSRVLLYDTTEFFRAPSPARLLRAPEKNLFVKSYFGFTEQTLFLLHL